MVTSTVNGLCVYIGFQFCSFYLCLSFLLQLLIFTMNERPAIFLDNVIDIKASEYSQHLSWVYINVTMYDLH